MFWNEVAGKTNKWQNFNKLSISQTNYSAAAALCSRTSCLVYTKFAVFNFDIDIHHIDIHRKKALRICWCTIIITGCLIESLTLPLIGNQNSKPTFMWRDHIKTSIHNSALTESTSIRRPYQQGKGLLPMMCWVDQCTLMSILKCFKSYRGIREQPCGPIFNIEDASHTVLTLIISEIISSFCIYWCIYWEEDRGFSPYCVMAIALSAMDQYLTEYYSRQCPKCSVLTYASVHSLE